MSTFRLIVDTAAKQIVIIEEGIGDPLYDKKLIAASIHSAEVRYDAMGDIYNVRVVYHSHDEVVDVVFLASDMTSLLLNGVEQL
jgi:hypothetical protein